MNRIIAFLLLMITLSAFSNTSMNSPDGNITINVFSNFGMNKNQHEDAETGIVFYNVFYKGQPVVLDSQLGLEPGAAPTFFTNMKIVNVEEKQNRNEWKPVYGERETIPDNYNQISILFKETIPPFRTIEIEFRAYNEGLAFRYIIPKQKEINELSITDEFTWFRFPKETFGWVEYGTEDIYRKLPLPKIEAGCIWPLTLELPNGLFACITESAVDNFSRSRFEGFYKDGFGLRMKLDGVVRGTAPFHTPWRTILVAETPGELLENNYMILNLNPPNELKDTSWIKPGKAIREVTLSTAGAKACVDFCVETGLQYVHFDAGWYGHEYAEGSDATTVSVDPRRNPKGDLDFPEAIKYAKERGIGVLLYVNRRALERQADKLFPLFQKWGIAGIKPGFVNVGEQEWTNWLHDIIRKAAKYRLMVDVHDSYRPSGFSRTYPNFMTQEGVRGNEHRPEALNNVILPFTRSIAGAADITPQYYAHRNTTFAHQLALPIAIYSPLQFLHWYSKPSGIEIVPELDLWKKVPTVWDDTKVLDGKIAEYVVIARRTGEEWYVGCLTDESARTLEFSMDFLQPGKKYKATIYNDDLSMPDESTKVRISEQTVTSDSSIKVDLVESGGCSVRIVPIK